MQQKIGSACSAQREYAEYRQPRHGALARNRGLAGDQRRENFLRGIAFVIVVGKHRALLGLRWLIGQHRQLPGDDARQQFVALAAIGVAIQRADRIGA